jgi:hypothetical protein
MNDDEQPTLSTIATCCILLHEIPSITVEMILTHRWPATAP